MSSRKRSSEYTDPQILTLGLTGLIGSGKSYVAQMLADRGLPVYDCDRRAKELYNEDPILKARIVDLFGDSIYDSKTGILDKQRLASIIFSDKGKLAEVNALVHPAIRHDFSSWRKNLIGQGFKACIIESAILLQASLVSYVDYIVVVTASEALRLQRACMRDKVNEAVIRERMRHQLSQDEIIRQADFVVHNEPNQALQPQLDTLLLQLSYTPKGR